METPINATLKDMGFTCSDTHIMQHLFHLKEQGYSSLEKTPTGECMPSECATHCGYVGKKATLVLVNQFKTYAHVLFTDNTWGDGTWHEYGNGDYCLG